MGAGDAHDAMAEPFKDAFEVHGDHRLILDDEHVGRHLRRDLPPGLIDKAFNLVGITIENAGNVLVGKAFDRAEQKGLPRQRRDGFELAVGRRRHASLHLRFEVEADGAPQPGEDAEQGNARIQGAVEQRRVLDQDLKRRGDIGVPGALRAGQRSRKTPQVGKMWCDRLRYGHAPLAFVRVRQLALHYRA